MEAGHSWGTEEENCSFFWECLCFIFSTITADGCMGACTDPVATNTISSAPGRKRGAKRFLMRGLLEGGPAVAGLDPLLFLSCRSGGRRRRRVQRYLGSGALALRRGVASGWAWTPSRLLSPSRLRGGNGRCRFRGLLSRRSPGATLSSCWAGALGQEVSHSLWHLLCLCEALSESFHRRSKEAAGGNWSIKEGDPVRVLNLRHREPQVALEHYQAGHRPSYGLGGSLGGSQSQVRCTSQLPESRRIRLRLIYGREELGLIDLENRHRVERRSRLSSWSVGASSERWSGPAWLGRVIGFRLPADGSGWAEMCSHWLIQLRHPLISLFFSAVNCSEGGWSGSTEGGQSKGSAKISWARRELQGRTAMVVAEGPDGAPAETTHPDGCERAPLVETTPNPALQPLLRGHGKVRHPSRLWQRWARANLRGRGQSLSPTAPQHLKLPVTCCHRPAHRHFPRTRPDRSRLQRDAGQVGKKGRETSLCVAKARHAGSEPAWARSQPGAENLCPAVFSSQVPGRKKTGSREGRGRSLKRKRSASAERRDWCSRIENNQSQRTRHLHGISPSRKHTRCDRHRRAGGTCTNRSNGAAL